MRVLLAVVFALGCTRGAADTKVTTPAKHEATIAPSASAPSSIVASAPSVVPPAAPPKLVVHLVPLGDVPLETLEEAAKGLRAHGPFAPTIEPRVALPSEAKTIEKGRWSADALLRFLQSSAAEPGEKVLGVAEVDIVTPKNGVPRWGVLGLGSIDGKSCVLSTWRMRRKWENGGAPESLVRERLWKIALHELGHTIGLEHCPNPGCLMQDAHGTVKSVDAESVLCATCAAKFDEVLARKPG